MTKGAERANSHIERVETVAEKMKLTGLNMFDLVDKRLINELKKRGIDVIPFMLVLDVKKESIVSITHNNPEEIDEKIIHVECKSSPEISGKHIDTIVKALKDLKGD